MKSCSPFSAAKWRGKNPDGQGCKGGDFFAPFAKKYYPSLDGLDRRNGRKGGRRNGAKCSLSLVGRYGIILSVEFDKREFDEGR